VQGELKVEPYAGVESTVLNHIRKWRIQDPAADAFRRGHSGSDLRPNPDSTLPFRLPADVAVQVTKQHGGFIIATVLPAVTREQVLSLKGREVFVSRAEFPQPEPDEYYWTDLIGCKVVDPAGSPLGQVVAVDDHGAQSVLRLDSGILIPFVSAHVLEVLPADKRIVADWSADWI